MPIKLTDVRVRTAPTKAARYSIMDATERGLEVRIHPDGRRVFSLRCSLSGRDVRIRIGRFGPEPLYSLQRAREQAVIIKARLLKEGDFRQAEKAAADEAAARRAYTLRSLIGEWEEHAAQRLRGSTLALHRQRLQTHVLPALGDCPLDDISRADVRRLVNAIGERGHYRTANCVAQLVSQLYRFARTELERDVQNPAADLKAFREHVRTRVLSDNEIEIFWRGLSATSMRGQHVALALKFALFSCQRIGEIVGMCDDEIDEKERIWLVPGNRTKSGRPNRVPLSTRLMGLVQEARLHRPDHLQRGPIFPSPRNPSMPITRLALSQAMSRLCAGLGLAAATPHDLRRTSRTILARESLGVSYDDAERLLSHVTGSAVSRVYNHHDYLAERRRALERLGVELDRIIAGRTHHEQRI